MMSFEGQHNIYWYK